MYINVVTAMSFIMEKLYAKTKMYTSLGISSLTGKRVKSNENPPVKMHLLLQTHSRTFGNFSIVA